MTKDHGSWATCGVPTTGMKVYWAFFRGPGSLMELPMNEFTGLTYARAWARGARQKGGDGGRLLLAACRLLSPVTPPCMRPVIGHRSPVTLAIG